MPDTVRKKPKLPARTPKRVLTTTVDGKENAKVDMSRQEPLIELTIQDLLELLDEKSVVLEAQNSRAGRERQKCNEMQKVVDGIIAELRQRGHGKSLLEPTEE